jgi:hypothetical protein
MNFPTVYEYFIPIQRKLVGASEQIQKELLSGLSMDISYLSKLNLNTYERNYTDKKEKKIFLI